MQPLQLGDDHPDVLRATRHFDVADPLQCHAEGHRMHVGADAANALEQGNAPGHVLALGQPLDAAEIEADLQVRTLDGLTVAVELDLVRLLERCVIGPDRNAVGHDPPP